MSGVIAGVGLSAFSTGASLFQGIQAKKLQRDAERAATEALNQAKEKLSVNRLEGVQIPLDAYDTAMREVTAQGGQAIDALTQGDARNLAAGVGKVYQAGQQGVEDIRQKKEQAIYNRDTAIAKEQANIDKQLADISLSEASGAQIAAAQHGEEAGQAFSNALSSFGGVVTGIASLSSPYGGASKDLDSAAEGVKDLPEFQGKSIDQVKQSLIDNKYTPDQLRFLSDPNNLNNLTNGLSSLNFNIN